MRSVVYRVSLLLVIILMAPMDYALAESPPAGEGSSILTSVNAWNTAVAQVPVDPNPSSYASAIGARAGVLPDSGTAKPKDPPPESTPSPGQPKSSFWQWLSGRTVDCSSGVCIFK